MHGGRSVLIIYLGMENLNSNFFTGSTLGRGSRDDVPPRDVSVGENNFANNKSMKY